ncbi:DNA/RNA non-specific endonuclease [Lactobacillus sp. ESL0679]|uniref:DNA/RNA non-specific endonuclease n=1 Tax=Lactobacillus sp. ESL0679 TaxID=2983209 RepID=UPI0023F6E91E|nr:DNA/RNA non-specific endonuclease [Lactobacillus sp. ESL0679]MDF7683773.1 DNA/RNA non-specific endonuclease [Lactobacillus sp. ESL0679]
MRNNRKKLISILSVGLALLSSGCSTTVTSSFSKPTIQKQDQSKVGGLSSKDYMKLSHLTYHQKEQVVRQVNHGRSTLKFSSWRGNQVIYQNLDYLNRTSGSNTAYLIKRNLANQAKRKRQNVKPTGWHYPYRNGVQIYNRGHLIAYSLTGGINSFGHYTGQTAGDQNNPKNLFTQSAYTNQKIQTQYEEQVRAAMRAGQRVIYQATPVFRGSELMARGINLQAKSADGMLNFNVYIFNVQPGFVFNYQTGNVRVVCEKK